MNTYSAYFSKDRFITLGLHPRGCIIVFDYAVSNAPLTYFLALVGCGGAGGTADADVVEGDTLYGCLQTPILKELHSPL